MFKILKWPALYALYVEMMGVPQHEVQQQVDTFKKVTMEMLGLVQEVITELGRAVQLM